MKNLIFSSLLLLSLPSFGSSSLDYETKEIEECINDGKITILPKTTLYPEGAIIISCKRKEAENLFNTLKIEAPITGGVGAGRSKRIFSLDNKSYCESSLYRGDKMYYNCFFVIPLNEQALESFKVMN